MLHGDQVDGLLGLIHVQQFFVEGLMPQVVEGLWAAFKPLDADAKAVSGGKKNAPENSLFGLDRVRGEPVARRRCHPLRLTRSSLATLLGRFRVLTAGAIVHVKGDRGLGAA